MNRSGLHSTAAIAGHPLHPLLVTLPIGFLIGAFFAITGWLGGEMVFRHGVGMTGEQSAVEIERKPQASRN